MVVVVVVEFCGFLLCVCVLLGGLIGNGGLGCGFAAGGDGGGFFYFFFPAVVYGGEWMWGGCGCAGFFLL